MRYSIKQQEKLSTAIGKQLKKNGGNITKTAFDLEMSTWKVCYWTDFDFREREIVRRH